MSRCMSCPSSSRQTEVNRTGGTREANWPFATGGVVCRNKSPDLAWVHSGIAIQVPRSRIDSLRVKCNEWQVDSFLYDMGEDEAIRSYGQFPGCWRLTLSGTPWQERPDLHCIL
jgi:hypothetical protein